MPELAKGTPMVKVLVAAGRLTLKVPELRKLRGPPKPVILPLVATKVPRLMNWPPPWKRRVVLPPVPMEADCPKPLVRVEPRKSAPTPARMRPPLAWVGTAMVPPDQVRVLPVVRAPPTPLKEAPVMLTGLMKVTVPPGKRTLPPSNHAVPGPVVVAGEEKAKELLAKCTVAPGAILKVPEVEPLSPPMRLSVPV